MTFVIAIDGPAAAGKGTLARALAAALNLAYLDTGTLYRVVGLKAAQAKTLDQATEIAQSLDVQDLVHPLLRSVQAGDYASRVAAQPGVRQALFNFQRNFGLNPPGDEAGDKAGAVLDGRDIGTVIFPEADVKLYITARAEVRAKRRYDELDPQTRPSLADMLAQVQARDARDSGRADSPLRPADDAHTIDTSDLSADDVFNLALSFVPKIR